MRRLGRPLGSLTLVSGPTNQTLSAAHGTTALAGQSAALRATRKLTAACGVFALAGQSLGFGETKVLTAGSGSFALAGQAAELRSNRFTCETGSFTLAGQNATVIEGRRLAAAAGTFTLSGQAVAFTTSVTYAVIENGRVVSIETGILPESTTETQYVQIPPGDPIPSVDDYFSEICQTFSSEPPTIPPGDIAPPYPPGSPPPVPGDEDYPGSDLPDEDDPVIPSLILPDLIELHADATTALPVVAATARTVIARAKQPYDTTNTCCIAVAADRETALAGVSLVGVWSANGVDGWARIAAGSDPDDPALDGPRLSLAETGPDIGCFVSPIPRGLVWLGVAIEGGDDETSLDLSSLSLFAYNKTETYADCPECPACGAPCCDVAFTASREAVVQDNFASFADMTALRAVYDSEGNGDGDSELLTESGCEGVTGGTTGADYRAVALTGGTTHLWVRTLLQWEPDAPVPAEGTLPTFGAASATISGPGFGGVFGRGLIYHEGSSTVRQHQSLYDTITLAAITWEQFTQRCSEIVLHYSVENEGGDLFLYVEALYNGVSVHKVKWPTALTGSGNVVGVRADAGIFELGALADYVRIRAIEVVEGGDTNPFAS